jgi:hexosaminidase
MKKASGNWEVQQFVTIPPFTFYNTFNKHTFTANQSMVMKMKIIAFLTFVISFSANAQNISIIPQPVELKMQNTQPFIINSDTKILLRDTIARKAAVFLKDYLNKYYKLDLPIVNSASGNSMITLGPGQTADKVPGSYAFTSSKAGVNINGYDGPGIFYGIQSLIQLLPVSTAGLKPEIPALTIRDYPRFQYRGLMLDVSRHMYIDYIALHKMNYFHWHLTDDQGWRLESKTHPKLNEIGSWRNGTIIGLFPGTGNDGLRYGGYYTHEQVKEVIRYASERFITVIPEIELPGHNMAVLATYPELSTTPDKPKEVAQTWGIYNRQNNVLVPSEKTFSFLQDVLTEVMDLFPSEYIHIGGDECSKMWWEASEFTQNFMKTNGLKDAMALQSYFIKRVEKIVNAKGKKIIGWNEILEGGLAPNAAVMSWQGTKGGIAAAKEKHLVVMSPSASTYFNHKQAAKEDSLTAAGRPLLIDSVYAYEPVPAVLTQEESKYIWGAQANMWTEYIANPRKVEYMLFPRLSALSEVVWSPKSARNWEQFKQKLPAQFKRYDLWKSNYSKEIFGRVPGLMKPGE